MHTNVTTVNPTQEFNVKRLFEIIVSSIGQGREGRIQDDQCLADSEGERRPE